MESRHCAILGASGSGKSTYLKAFLSKERRVIALDVKDEINRWHGFSKYQWKGPTAFAKYIQNLGFKAFKIAICLPLGATTEWQNVANEIAHVSLLLQQSVNAGKREDALAVVFEEANVSIPVASSRRAHPFVLTLANQGRSYGIGMVVVSQSPSLVDKDIRRACRYRVTFRQGELDDVKAAEASLGPQGKGMVQGMKRFEFVERDNDLDELYRGKVLQTGPPKYTGKRGIL